MGKQSRQMLMCFWKSLIPVGFWGISTILGHTQKSQTAVPLLLPSSRCRIGVYRASQIFAAFTRSDIFAMIRRECGVAKWRMEATRSAVPLPIPLIAVGMVLVLPSILRTLRTLRSLLHGSGAFMRAGTAALIADRITSAVFVPLTALSIAATITGTSSSAM